MIKILTIIKIIIRKISVQLIIFISNFSPKLNIINYLFNLLKKLSFEAIYFAKYSDKEKILRYLKKKQEIYQKEIDEKYSNHPIKDNMGSVLEDLNYSGISEKLKIEIYDKEITEFVENMKIAYTNSFK